MTGLQTSVRVFHITHRPNCVVYGNLVFGSFRWANLSLLHMNRSYVMLY
jgi:hypothetical protein